MFESLNWFLTVYILSFIFWLQVNQRMGFNEGSALHQIPSRYGVFFQLVINIIVNIFTSLYCL